ncbi:hypothetical protein [Nocardia farcinica]|uniref:hypothetical protein n=1 Tax=Nocardia farcinica TaxID=37329 RepID=UPI002458BE70|nr:hypothetical protein [Nocardia farcinica]
MDTNLTALTEMRCCAQGLSAGGFVQGALRQCRAAPRVIPGNSIRARAVVAEVTGHGLCLPGNFRDDTPTTVRVDRLRLEGRVWIRSRVDAGVVEAVQRRYPFVRIERFSHLSEVPDMVEGSKQST